MVGGPSTQASPAFQIEPHSWNSDFASVFSKRDQTTNKTNEQSGKGWPDRKKKQTTYLQNLGLEGECKFQEPWKVTMCGKRRIQLS